uniref:(northern house mosquito) hypothetical protein n=1 Tax=Culex pipiens TaxID=7175 RepID=A0A8D7ZVW6_CULPI
MPHTGGLPPGVLQPRVAQHSREGLPEGLRLCLHHLRRDAKVPRHSAPAHGSTRPTKVGVHDLRKEVQNPKLLQGPLGAALVGRGPGGQRRVQPCQRGKSSAEHHL